MTYGDFKDLPRRTGADKQLPNKTFNSAKNPRYRIYVFINYFDEKTAGGSVTNEIM